MRATASLVTFNQTIMRRCKNLLIRITRSCPRRHYRHLKLQKASSSSSSSSSGKQGTKVLASFFLSFQKKKQKKEKMKRLNELRSFSDAVSERKASNPESRKKVFPSSWLCQGKAHSQEVSQGHDPPRDSTSAFLP
ncbi:uncharacterized protein LOC9329633 [Arabidopsis lyrata subsp. lyrata]|uniref:uncharacterized protein LOC9329633 n=1 Tax=Arabidopsis lyrata subsp. lyrata TaxID=81972 RepID=UPI000A29E3D0|nr:uncharacterized protein LOC9329633 [Arabidopsis lyrata subsp. lyrata]|eukprot:XP_020867240.1 uncharacterized protein LOC9329633 [Arabidopsis lyrata subsp. lyrata]